MFKRVWTPKEYAFQATESKITIYDFGAFYGELVDDDWTCWEIVSRTKVSGEIVEMLRACPQDWVPGLARPSCQTYTGTAANNTISIRGWSLQTTELEKESPVSEWDKGLQHPLPQQQSPPQPQRQNPRPQQQTRPPLKQHVLQSLPHSRQQHAQPPSQRQVQGHSPRHAPPHAQSQRQPQSRQQQPPRQPQSRQPQSRQQQPPQRPPPPSSEHGELPQEGKKIAASPKILRGKTQTIANSSVPSSVQWTPLVQIAQQPASPRR